MNPVNEYLAPIFERAFASLIRENLLRIVTGGADVGAGLTSHPAVDELHITGSTETHDRIVWGSDPEEQQRRKKRQRPVSEEGDHERTRKRHSVDYRSRQVFAE